MIRLVLAIFTMLAAAPMSLAVSPSQMVLMNQFGEVSKNYVQGTTGMPLVPGSSKIVGFAGTGAPVNGTTGDNFAGIGSLYFRTSNGAIYVNTGALDNPTWSTLGTMSTSTLLTGYTFSGGEVAATDTILEAFQKIGPATASPSLTFDHSVGGKTVVVKQVGKLVSLTIPAGAFADGAGTVVASSALASGYRPSAALTFSVLVIDNGTTRKAGQLVVGSNGVLTFSVLGAGFTNAQAGGWDATSVSYAIP